MKPTIEQRRLVAYLLVSEPDRNSVYLTLGWILGIPRSKAKELVFKCLFSNLGEDPNYVRIRGLKGPLCGETGMLEPTQLIVEEDEAPEWEGHTVKLRNWSLSAYSVI